MRLAILLALAALPLAAAAAPLKMALMPFAPSAGVAAETADAFTEAVGAELRRAPDVQLVTKAEITALLSHEQQKQALGCDDAACAADLGGALGVDQLVLGSLSRLGESWLVHLKVIDVKKAVTVKQVDRRLRGGTIDDVLDELPAMSAELVGAPAPAIVREQPKAAPAAAPAKPGFAEVARDVSAIRERLVLLTDGAGRYVAYDPKGDTWDPFFAGDARTLYAQRIIGGGSNGADFSRTFWDPRAKSGWQRSFEHTGGAFHLQCGDRKVALKPVPAAEAKGLLAAAKFHEPRWQRRAFAIARDDTGTYWYVDQAREPEGNGDFRLFVGRKGRLQHVVLEDAILDDAGQLFVSERGRLRMAPAKREAEWIEGRAKTPLSWLDVEEQASFAYGALGVYAGEKLGTACDDRF